MFDLQSEWAALLLASLRDAGVRDAVISPGSRSTPLVWAACQTEGLRCHTLIDERSAGYFALGQARVSGVPSLLICTSGTAVSHYYPAVIEARESGIPLLVSSADRPLELMFSSAHQTIDQTRLFGSYATYHELGEPSLEPGRVTGLRRIAWQAVADALEAPRGAVHLNFRARKPLEPRLLQPQLLEPKPGQMTPTLSPARALPPATRLRQRTPIAAELEWVRQRFIQCRCPLLICGASAIADAPDPELVARFAARTGAIVCAESVSQLRLQLAPELEQGLLCDASDWLLGSAVLRPELRPDFALQLGGAPVSAELSRLLQQNAPQLELAICAESGWPDSLHGSAQIVRARANDLLEALCDSLPMLAPERPALGLWRAANQLARSALARHVQAGFGEAAAVHAVVESLPRGSLLVIGNSLAPRTLDRYCPAAARGIRICSQRGTSGIEGGISGALGAATCAASMTTLLIGDISFLHDVGGLWAASAERVGAAALEHPVLLVVLNNRGGRIFEQLPIARQQGVDLARWTTPHALSLAGVAHTYGVGYTCAKSRDELLAALTAARGRAGVQIIEIELAPDSARSSLTRVSGELESEFAALLAQTR